VNIVPSPEISIWFSTAATAASPHPAKSAAANVSEPPDVSMGSLMPVALTAELSEAPEAVGSAAAPLEVIEREPAILQSPSTYISIPLVGRLVVNVTLASIVKSLKLPTHISPS
jgi:hypothetical protein